MFRRVSTASFHSDQTEVDVFDNAPNLKVRPSIPYFLQTNFRLEISSLFHSSEFAISDRLPLSLHSSEVLCTIQLNTAAAATCSFSSPMKQLAICEI